MLVQIFIRDKLFFINIVTSQRTIMLSKLNVKQHFLFKAIILILLLPLFHANAEQTGATMTKPKVIIFDVNETLLDLEPLRTSIAKVLNGRDDLLSLWFSTMLHYSLVETVIGNYRDFAQIGAASLVMVAENHGIKLTKEMAKQAIIETITQLPPHADVKNGLAILKNKGFYLVSLTNSSNAGVKAQFDYAGLTEYFSRRFSVEDVKAFKPAPITYQWALRELNVKPSDVLMVAAHAWDLAGAKAAGMQTAFIRRPNTALYPNTAKPDYVVNNLNELIEQLPKK